MSAAGQVRELAALLKAGVPPRIALALVRLHQAIQEGKS